VVAAEGARERRKRVTRQAISEAAVRLFLERGYDAVSVADIAAEAGVSKMTVFNYFDSKEDLLLRQLEQQVTAPADLVRQRPSGMSPLGALEQAFLTAVAEHDPSSGLCPDARFIAFRSLIVNSSALSTGLIAQSIRSEKALAGALAEVAGVDEFLATVAAGQLMSLQRTLSTANFNRIMAGGELATMTAAAIEDAELGFGLVRSGLAGTVLG